MKYIRICLVCLCLLLLCSCGKEQKQKQQEKLKPNEIYYYFTNPQMTNVVRRREKINESVETEEQVITILEDLANEGSNETVQTPIPSDLVFDGVEYEKEKKDIKLRFKVTYDNLQLDQILMAKVCVVETVLQLKDVDTVTLVLTDVMNSDVETSTVTEQYNLDSFVMSFDENNGYAQKGHIVLYFANETGDALKEYNKSIEITNNMSLAAIVVESLIAGPQREGYQATIPEDTSIRNILIKDGICYVDLSDEFYETDNSMKNDLIVYSIVNSLVDLPTVSKVQFLKNGEKQEFYRESMPFDSLFERNLDLIEQENIEAK